MPQPVDGVPAIGSSAGPASGPPVGATYRTRARDLSHHHAGQSRGAFLLNDILSTIAVLLATVSLALIGASGHTPMVKERHDLLRASSILEADSAPAAAVPTNRGPRVPPNWEAGVKPSADTQTVPGENNPWMPPVLICLAAIKLALLIFIKVNTRLANAGRWNERAIDNRYFAERLRNLEFLPRLGSLRVPSPGRPQLASRIFRQSTVDWLFEAITRTVNPADLCEAGDSAGQPCRTMVTGTSPATRIFSPNPLKALMAIRAYGAARQRYGAAGVDTEAALATLAGIPISLQSLSWVRRDGRPVRRGPEGP